MSSSNLLQPGSETCQCRQQQLQREAKGAAAVTNATAETLQPAPGDAVSRAIDVSTLPPPLPMVRILETLREIGPGQTLLVRHTRRPIHLYPKLDALGCTHETTEPAPGRIELRITTPVASLP